MHVNGRYYLDGKHIRGLTEIFPDPEQLKQFMIAFGANLEKLNGFEMDFEMFENVMGIVAGRIGMHSGSHQVDMLDRLLKSLKEYKPTEL